MVTDNSYIRSGNLSALTLFRWMLPLIVFTLIAIIIAWITVGKRKLVEPIQLLTVVIIAIYLLLATIFLWININCQWILAVSFGTLKHILRLFRGVNQFNPSI